MSLRIYICGIHTKNHIYIYLNIFVQLFQELFQEQVDFGLSNSYSYQKRFDKVLSFVVMGASEDLLHLNTLLCMK